MLNLPENIAAFIGQKIEVTETPLALETMRGENYNFTHREIDRGGVTIKILAKTAAEMGLSLCVWFPETRGISNLDTDRLTDRLNVIVEEYPTGQWKITRMHFG